MAKVTDLDFEAIEFKSKETYNSSSMRTILQVMVYAVIIPKYFETAALEKTIKEPPNLVWHVATFKDGKDNLIKTINCI